MGSNVLRVCDFTHQHEKEKKKEGDEEQSRKGTEKETSRRVEAGIDKGAEKEEGGENRLGETKKKTYTRTETRRQIGTDIFIFNTNPHISFFGWLQKIYNIFT